MPYLQYPKPKDKCPRCGRTSMNGYLCKQCRADDEKRENQRKEGRANEN